MTRLESLATVNANTQKTFNKIIDRKCKKQRRDYVRCELT